MKHFLLGSVLFALIAACTTNEEWTRPDVIELIEVREPNYSFTYPNAWERKPTTVYSSTDIQSHAYSNVQFDYYTVPDSAGGEAFVKNLEAKQYVKFEVVRKKNKKYYHLKYEPGGAPSTCEHIYYIDRHNIYSMVHCYSNTLTPQNIIREGREILNSFAVHESY